MINRTILSSPPVQQNGCSLKQKKGSCGRKNLNKIWCGKIPFYLCGPFKKRQFLQVCLRPEKFDISSNNFGYLHKGSYLCNPNKKGGLVKPKRSLKVWKQQQHKTRFEFRFYGKVYSNQIITTYRLLISIY